MKEGCRQENDLIAFLYGELDPVESTVFRSHLQECPSCAAELREFTDIRESVVSWRDEALAGVRSTGVQASPVAGSDVAKPSALAALREFFNLSPLWMKGAVVFASLLLCLLAVLAAARLRETPPPPTANNSSTESRSDQAFNAAVERRVQEELDRIKNSPKPAPGPNVIAERGSNLVSPRRSLATISGPQYKARRPLSKVERQQLAADLRLIDSPTDGDLDLLDDRINQ